MGISDQGLQLLKKYDPGAGSDVLEFGCQNFYDSENYGVSAAPILQEMFGWKILSADLIGCYEFPVVDLRERQELGEFDLVTNFGCFCCVEGRRGFWQSYENAHRACRVGGLMIHKTPKIGATRWSNEPMHHFVTKEFYRNLAERMNYEILEIGEHNSHGDPHGRHVFICLKKLTDNEFMSFFEFDQLDFCS